MNDKDVLTQWRRNFFTGLAIVLPGVVSVAVLIWLFGTVSNVTDTLLFFLPRKWTHESINPGDGKGTMYWYWSLVAFALAVILITLVGRAARNYFGKKAIEWTDHFILRIPLLNKIYGTIKQVNEAFSSNKSSFKGVVIVPFPQANSYSIGFVTGEHKTLLPSGAKLTSVFIPTTPNPTSGFLIMVPEEHVTKLDMTVADGIKFIISLGAISPELSSEHVAALKASSSASK